MMIDHPVRSTLAAIARLEADDVRPARLTQPGFEKWSRLRRKLGWGDFIDLLHLDLAGAFPVPFDRSRWPDLAPLSEADAEALVREASTPSDRTTMDFLREQARQLGLPAGGAIADLPKVQPHQMVLELPGSGGRIAAHQSVHDNAISLDGPFTFVVASPVERIAIGLAAAELRSNEPTVWSVEELAAAVDGGQTFDRVFGLDASPDAHALVERFGFREARLV